MLLMKIPPFLLWWIKSLTNRVVRTLASNVNGIHSQQRS